MKTKTIGELLQEERQRHHLSIEQLAQHTRVKVEYLRALEANQFAELPAATFVKGYIKTYAKLFGFDYEPLLALLRRDFKESAAGKLVPREFIKPLLKKKHVWTPVTLAVIALGVVFMSLILYVGLQWYSIQKPPILQVTSPKDDDFVSQNITVKGVTVDDAIVTVNEQPVTIQPTGSFQTTLYIPRDGIYTLTVTSTDRRGKTNVVQRSVHVRQQPDEGK